MEHRLSGVRLRLVERGPAAAEFLGAPAQREQPRRVADHGPCRRGERLGPRDDEHRVPCPLTDRLNVDHLGADVRGGGAGLAVHHALDVGRGLLDDVLRQPGERVPRHAGPVEQDRPTRHAPRQPAQEAFEAVRTRHRSLHLPEVGGVAWGVLPLLPDEPHDLRPHLVRFARRNEHRSAVPARRGGLGSGETVLARTGGEDDTSGGHAVQPS
ncbi:hypothetical protein OG417_48280 [Actinoallomurus sp. NBC_01490]|uniref:hypothetical protein n=1 Tax=Actinoallomurus sp. NBC_01490 TaxID=2903557 RepID=UPI002E342555|nr:hypothetical protein [Actinoallomurus sp. NBC_01490]